MSVGRCVLVGGRVRVEVAVLVIVRVGEGSGVLDGRGVRETVGEDFAVGVAAFEGFIWGVLLAVTPGGLPVTVKCPDDFISRPLKINTSYSPGSHSDGEGFQSVYP